jgi:mannitol-1-phosphate/altronate dehydrogenase
MKSGRGKVYGGFGFGPIQSALFLYEAYRTGNFGRFAVADVDEQLVEAVRANDGRYTINIAHPDRIDRATVEGVELYNSRVPEQAERFVEALAVSDEMCTALPSVSIYSAGGGTSVVNLLARGLSARAGTGGRELPTIVYTAENNNRAAEILGGQVYPLIPPSMRENVQFLNTVIAKMSGVIADPQTMERLALAPITPGFPRAVLVEQFNRILISKIRLPGYRRGIEVFAEKDDLLPYEEVKFHGHNAVHALIAYLAELKGYRIMSEAGRDGWIMAAARRALIEEAGVALIRARAGLEDPLFTEPGYRDFAEDLLGRIVNPNLNDLVERVGRDHRRKLGIEDRLYGTMIIALEQGVSPVHLALGAAAAVASMIRRRESLGLNYLPESFGDLDREGLERLLRELWGEHPAVRKHGGQLIDLTWEAARRLRSLGMA